MKINITNQEITDFTGDIIIINLFEGVHTPGGATSTMDKALSGIISKLIRKDELSGKLGETVIVHTFGKIKADKVLIVGLGKTNDLNVEQIRKAAGAAIKRARKAGARKVGTIVHGAGIGGIEPRLAALQPQTD